MNNTKEFDQFVSSEDESLNNNMSLSTQINGRKKYKHLRFPRQKYCLRWEQDFTWLKADKKDESIGICTICNKRLVCKKSHLERHEKSFKHQRHLGFETSVINYHFESEQAVQDFYECQKSEPEIEVEYDQSIEVGDYSIEYELKGEKLLNQHKNKLDKSPKNVIDSTEANITFTDMIDRTKLLKSIDRDRKEINTFLSNRLTHRFVSPYPQKDSFDLFFESICASVKLLPPKLAAEAKSKVSQLIADFELRAILERESKDCMTSSSVNDSKFSFGNSELISTLPNIIYSFQSSE